MLQLKIGISGEQAKKLGKVANILDGHFKRLHPDGGSVEVGLELEPELGAEGFRISRISLKKYLIAGGDFKGVLYGAGKFIRSFHVLPNGDAECFAGVQKPEKAFRGIYFASHFHNFYQDAPLEDIHNYIEELALWGCNVLCLWFDIHQYYGIDDPNAIRDMVFFKKIADRAKFCGMDIVLTSLANEAYYTSPKEIRADWNAQNGYSKNLAGHYHCEVCPNKPGGLDYILTTRQEVLKICKDTDFPVDYFAINPYDQGGCTCSKCLPWGARGFLQTAEAVGRLVHGEFSDAKIVLSTWRFGERFLGEWQQFAEEMTKDKPDWITYMMADNSLDGLPDYVEANGSPCGIPILSFPEITSMRKMLPWGGFGANPAPKHWGKYFERIYPMIEGALAYSEGLHDDINKVIVLQKLWDGKRDVMEIVVEYVRTAFSWEYCDDIVKLIFELEKTLGHKFFQEASDEVYYSIHNENAKTLAAPNFALACAVDAKLPDAAKKSWRWRILWLRSAIDAEIIRTNGKVSSLTEKYFYELTGIYHVNDRSRYVVAPPVLKRVEKPLVDEDAMDDWSKTSRKSH